MKSLANVSLFLNITVIFNSNNSIAPFKIQPNLPIVLTTSKRWSPILHRTLLFDAILNAFDYLNITEKKDCSKIKAVLLKYTKTFIYLLTLLGHCWDCTDISFTDSIIDITQYLWIPLPLYEGATDIWGLPNRPTPLTGSQYLPMNCDIYRSSPGVYCMVLFPTCNKNLPIVSTAFQWHPQYNKLKARVSQSHKVRPIIHTQWQDANLSFAKRFPIPNKIYNFMCENVNSFTDSDKEL